MIKHLFCCCFIVCMLMCKGVSAQKDTIVFYLDSSSNITNEENALYKEVAVKSEVLWYASLMHINLGVVTMKGSFTDESLHNKEGLFEYYYPDGSIQNTGNYKNGKQEGTWRMYDAKRQLIDSAFYINGQPKAEGIYNYYRDGKLQRYEFKSLITNQKIMREYDTSGHIKFYSEFLNKDGQTNYYYPNGIVKDRTVFEKNLMVSMDHFDETGRKLTDKEYAEFIRKSVQQLLVPEYPGGDLAFFKYVERGLKSNSSIRNQINDLGSITITFFLDENGSPYNIQVVDYSPVDVSNALIDIIKHMSPWEMYGMKSFGPVRRSIRFL